MTKTSIAVGLTAVAAATFLAVAEPVSAGPTGITVRSESGWQATDVRLDAGQALTVHHLSGDWTVGSPGLPRVGPGGYASEADRQIYQGCKILTDQPYGRLLARVGDSPPFAVATGSTLTAPAAGVVSFRIHDDDRCLGDNAGALDLTVDTAATPSPGGTGAVLYAADWSSGLGGWVGGPAWKVLRGALLNDGTGDGNAIIAPYDTKSLVDYAIEAKIRVIRHGSWNDFGLVARRTTERAGYDGRVLSSGSTHIGDGADAIAEGKPFTPDNQWHTYRFEVDGNVVTFFVDGGMLATVTDNKFLDGGLSGIYCAGYQLEVASYRVLRLR